MFSECGCVLMVWFYIVYDEEGYFVIVIFYVGGLFEELFECSGCFFILGEFLVDLCIVIWCGGCEGDVFYCDWWSYDKVV